MTISSSITLKPGDMLVSSIEHSLAYYCKSCRYLLHPGDIVLVLDIPVLGWSATLLHGENIFKADKERLYSSFVLVESNT